MILSYADILGDGARHQISATITTAHSASSYGQPVVLLEDGDLLDMTSWALLDYQVIEASDTELAMLRAWLTGRAALPVETATPSKYDEVWAALPKLLQSEKIYHLDALEQTDLLDALTVEQLAEIVRLMQAAYRRGQSDTGAEKVDTDAVWVTGVGMIERQPDGTWRLTGADAPDVVVSSAAAAMGRKTSARKTAASRANGKKGGWPKGRPRKPQTE